MPELREQQRDVLNEKSAPEYAEWLLGGFKDWYDPAYRHQAFVPISFLLSVTGPSLWTQLADVYDKLSGAGRKAFEEGLVQALINCPRRDAWANILWQLVHLGVNIRASGMIEPLGKILDEKYLTNGLTREARHCFARVVNILCSYHGEPQMHLLWSQLLQHDQLPTDDAPLLFLSLCRNGDIRLSKCLKWAQPHFQRLLQSNPSDFPQRMIIRLAEVVSITMLAEQLQHLRLVDRKEHSLRLADNWFLQALVAETWSPYQLRNTGDQYVIRKRNSESEWVTINGPEKESKKENLFYSVLQMMVPRSLTYTPYEIHNHYCALPAGSVAETQTRQLERAMPGLNKLRENLLRIPNSDNARSLHGQS
ncbi:MAG: hypothetical protein HQM04_03230 [Magnetococcales bacterium]|nr:hypothetical protein [Magnetococcales bacterium]MBF0114035.1 hypothetical protein [Magnetococcales bacterium]